MSMLLRGAPAAAALNEKTAQLVSGLREKGVVPTLAIVRLGAREDDLSYERAAVKRCAAVGIETRCVSLPENASGEALEETLRALSDDASVHGILLLRPLPAALDEARILRAIASEKDVDGAAEGSLAAVYAGTDEGFAPCTAQAVLELLDYYEIPIEGKRAVVLAGQTVIDVGIHYNEETQKLCGDVALAEADGVVRAVTPVPGGVGALTTAVLAAHTAKAAARRIK